MITSRLEVANLLNRIFVVQTSKYNLIYNMNTFTWFKWLLFCTMKWDKMLLDYMVRFTCHFVILNIQAFIMDDLIVCMSLNFEYSIVANKREIFKLERNTFYKKCRTQPPWKRRSVRVSDLTLGETTISSWLCAKGTTLAPINTEL